MTLNQNHESGRDLQMLDRSFGWMPRHSVQANRLPCLGIIILLALTVSGMEARADDDRSVSTLFASSVALLQAARAPSSVARHEEAEHAFELAKSDEGSAQDGIQPVFRGLDLDISPEPIDGIYGAVGDNEQTSARTARIASCYQAAVGRYHAEERGAFTNTLSDSTRFDAALTHFTAQRASRLQFDSCLRF